MARKLPGFNTIADQIRTQIKQVAGDTRLSIGTVVGVLSGKFSNAMAHGELCRQSIERAAGGEDRFNTLSRHVSGNDLD